MTSACIFWRSLRYVVAPIVFALILAGPSWQNSDGQPASGTAAVQAQPAEAGSPTGPKPRERVLLPVLDDAKLPTSFLVGNSTVRNGQGNGGGGQPDVPAQARASLPGVGPETVEIENLVLKMHEAVQTYGWYLRKIVQDTKEKGATPIVCSLIPRKMWKDEKVVRNKDNFAGWAQQVAEQEHVGFLDLNGAIRCVGRGCGRAAVWRPAHAYEPYRGGVEC